MSVQETADKVYKHYEGPKGPGFNVDSLADSMARITNFSFQDSKKALEKSANKK